jgi:hypothetical protein
MGAAAKWVMRWVLNFAGWVWGLGAGGRMTALQRPPSFAWSRSMPQNSRSNLRDSEEASYFVVALGRSTEAEGAHCYRINAAAL